MPDDYWRQFMHTVSFATPTTVKGILEGRKQDGPRDDPFPVLLLRTDSGYKLKVNVTQTRLLGELIRARPELGDEIEIVYHGPADKAPPGMSPTKEFSVHVIRKGSRAPEPVKTTSGEVVNTSRPGPGK